MTEWSDATCPPTEEGRVKILLESDLLATTQKRKIQKHKTNLQQI